MSVLSRFFIAGTETGVDTTGITDIELSSLDEILTGVKDRGFDSDDDEEDDDDDDDDDEEDDDEEDDDLVFVVHDDVVAALVAGDTTSLRLAAVRWAMTPELGDSDADVLFDLVLDLATLARRAVVEKRPMRLRISG